jgi:hypothetical protein
LGFPGYRDQSALSFLKGGSSSFLQFLCLLNHVEVKIVFCKCLVQFLVSSGIIRLLDFLIFFGHYREYCFFFCSEGSFFLLFSVTFVSDVCLSIYYTCFLLCLLLVCWVRENFSGGSGHIFSVWDSAVWSAGPVQFI